MSSTAASAASALIAISAVPALFPAFLNGGRCSRACRWSCTRGRFGRHVRSGRLEILHGGDWSNAGNSGRRLQRAIQLEDLLLYAGHNLVVFVVIFEEIRNVEKRIPLQADIDERRLHARKHARHSSFMNAASQRVFILALVENLDYLIFFQDGHACFVAAG
jgi:hypothetical protein